MKVHELIRELSALCGVGLRDAEVEVQIVTRRGTWRRRVVATDRSSDHVPSVVLMAVPHQAETDEEDG